jgi:predicted glycoside hydrolase/deacetylase ChbG (UPF0249 family)
MKYLIVNADDFGAGAGINRGIEEGHRSGIVTSTSLMVDEPFSAEAAAVSAELPRLSAGLHVKLTSEHGELLIDIRDTALCREEVLRQLNRFRELVGSEPTHLDSHHDVHLRPPLDRVFAELAEPRGLPVRWKSPVRMRNSFYGQLADGTSSLEQIGVENLERILRKKVTEGLNQIACHPGYVDEQFSSPYSLEREIELRTLCDPRVGQILEDLEIELISFRDATRLLETWGQDPPAT